MKNKIVLTILGLFSAVLLIGSGMFVAQNRAYVKDHMEQVNQEVLSLAQELGYTPDTLLRHNRGISDVSLAPPFDAMCMNQLLFETPLTAKEFIERLSTALPSSKGEGQVIEDSSLLFSYFDFSTENPGSTEAEAFLQRKTQTRYWWYLADGRTSISLFDTLNLPVTLVYKGRPITGNVVEIYIKGGRFPPPINDCPVKSIER